MALPSSGKFNDNFNIIAADKIVAIGLTLFFGKSGAEPWHGSYKPNAVFLSGKEAKDADGNKPQGTWDNGGFIGDDITKHVAGDYNTI